MKNKLCIIYNNYIYDKAKYAIIRLKRKFEFIVNIRIINNYR